MKAGTILLYALARFEVTFRRPGTLGPDHTADYLDPRFIPSVAGGNWTDRVLAEFDQTGIPFATDPADRAIFPGRGRPCPRQSHRLEVVLANRSVRVRKDLIRRAHRSVTERLRQRLDWDFYLEAAALRRLAGCQGIPALRLADRRRGVIEMDYIDGVPIGAGLEPESGGDELEKGIASLPAGGNGSTLEAVMAVVERVIERGVVPRDLHPANFIRATNTGTLYLVDFNLVFLRPAPGWAAAARRVTDLLRHRLTDPNHPR